MGFDGRILKIEGELAELRQESMRKHLDALDAAGFVLIQLAYYLESSDFMDMTGFRNHILSKSEIFSDERISRINAVKSILRQIDTLLALRVIA